MAADEVNVKLTDAEWRLIAGLRDIPPSPLRDLMHTMVAELLAYVREPKCTEIQADGVPCETPAADCEQCLKVKQLLLSLRQRVAAA
jgi:hypothetical protein